MLFYMLYILFINIFQSKPDIMNSEADNISHAIFPAVFQIDCAQLSSHLTACEVSRERGT